MSALIDKDEGEGDATVASAPLAGDPSLVRHNPALTSEVEASSKEEPTMVEEAATGRSRHSTTEVEQTAIGPAGADPSDSIHPGSSRRPPLPPSAAAAAATNHTVAASSQRHPSPSAASSSTPPASAFVAVGTHQMIRPHATKAPSPQAAFAAPVPPPQPALAAAPPSATLAPPRSTAAGNVGMSPFDNPSLNFSWPVFAPPPIPAAAAPPMETPALMLSPNAPYTPQAPVPAQPAYNTYSPQQPQQTHSYNSPQPPQHQHQQQQSPAAYLQPYGSPSQSYGPPAASHMYDSPPPLAMSPPALPPMNNLTPEQQQFILAGWQQAQYFQQLALANQQPPPPQQQQPYNSNPYPYQSPPPVGGSSANPYYPQTYEPPYPVVSPSPPAAAVPKGTPRSWANSAAAASSGLPTAPYIAPSFAPITASPSGPLPTAAPTADAAGLMVLTPRMPPPHGQTKKTHTRNGREESSSSEDDTSGSDSSVDARSRPTLPPPYLPATSTRAVPLLAGALPIMPMTRSVSDPPLGLGTPRSPKRAQKGQKPVREYGGWDEQGRAIAAASDLMYAPNSAPSTAAMAAGLHTPDSGTSLHGVRSSSKKPAWKVPTERDRWKAEVLAKERANGLAGNRANERAGDMEEEMRGLLSSTSSLRTPPAKNELTRRSPSARRSPSSTGSLTPSSTGGAQRRPSSTSKGERGDTRSPGNGPTKPKRSVVVGALTNPNSDLEISIFLTLLLVIVGGLSLFFLIR